MSLEKFVRAGKQRLAEALGLQGSIMPSAIREEAEAQKSLRIPQASGEERTILIIRANELVSGETFDPPSLADFVGTMRGLVGLINTGASNALPYNLDRGFGTDGYLEFFAYKESAQISAMREDGNRGISGYERAITIYHPEEKLNSFALRMALPIRPHDLFYFDWLLDTGKELTFTTELPSPGGGKGSIIFAQASLSEAVVQNFCRNILGRLENMPQDYTFTAGEVIDRRREASNKRLWNR